MWNEIDRMEVGDKVVSDHHPVMVRLKEGGSDRRNRRRRNERVCRGIWDEGGRKEFGERLGRVEMVEGETQEGLEKLEEGIRGTLEKVKEKEREG